MSTITRTGNLAATPQLREGEHGKYCYARVIVNDRYQDKDGKRLDGPAVAYDVAVSGNQAEQLVDTAERCGNVRVTFSGRYRVTAYEGESGTRIQHEVRADEIAVSLRGQTVTVERSTRAEESGAGDEPAGEDTPF